MVPVPKHEIDQFDGTLQNMILESDCDSCSYIDLPKLLAMEDGAEELLQWYHSTSREHGTGNAPVKDTRHVCAPHPCTAMTGSLHGGKNSCASKTILFQVVHVICLWIG